MREAGPRDSPLSSGPHPDHVPVGVVVINYTAVLLAVTELVLSRSCSAIENTGKTLRGLKALLQLGSLGENVLRVFGGGEWGALQSGAYRKAGHVNQ